MDVVHGPQRYQVDSKCFVAEVGEVSMVLLPTLEYLELDEVSTSILRAFGVPRSVDDTVTELLAAYEVDEVVVRADVVRIVEHLMAHGAIHACAPG